MTALAIWKIGGSVLTGLAGYHRAADAIAARRRERPEQRLLIVVSAEHGTTDALLDTARAIVDAPDPGTLDLLWSTGELRSVALLVLCLHRRGVEAAGLNIHQTGLLRADHGTAGAARLRALRLRAALARHDVVVAPGFLARGAGEAVVSLGRGGSDLTAVLLAAGLGADCCELIKDVPGYFSSDPHQDDQARHLPQVDSETALGMARAGCRLIQPQALEAAHRAAVPLVVRSLDGERQTIVG